MKPVLHAGLITGLCVSTLGLSACRHQVEVVAPSEPIRIELAIRIDQEVRVRLDDDVEALIENNPDLF
jgi:hypothetical protein